MLKLYSSLYAPDLIRKSITQKFLDKLYLPSVTPSQLKTLNAPISISEISKTIRLLAPNKAPGADGFTGEFYKTLCETIKPTLLSVNNGIWTCGPYLPTGNQVIIKLLSKKRKISPLGSYRPISLLNLDIKILSKIAATRLMNIIPSLIHPTESGFVKVRSATLIIRKVMMVLEHAKINPGKEFSIITLDAENAFDVSFEWLSMVLTKMGITGPFNHLVSLMSTSLQPDWWWQVSLLKNSASIKKRNRGAPSHCCS